MKIAMVSEHANPLAALGGVDAGGQNVHVASLSAALARRGHEVVVYTRRDSETAPRRVDTGDGYAVVHVDAGPRTEISKDELLPFVPELSRGLDDAISASRPDVVHAHFWMSGLASMLATRGTDLPVVQTFHALGTVKRRHQRDADSSPAARIRIERALARDAARVVATCSDEVFELVRMGARRTSVSVVPCGVDVDHFTPSGDIAQLPETGRAHKLLVVGRLVARKGVDDVIRALRFLPDTDLLIAGGPARAELDADPEVQRLRRIADQAKVLDRVIFLGSTSRAEMPALMRAVDVLVTVPWYEPFGIVPLEAMACGLPVVASAVGGLQDTVVDGTTGLLVPPRQPQLLAEALRRLLQDPVRREAFGFAGVDRARARYNWDRVAQDTEAVYQSLLTLALPSFADMDDEGEDEMVDLRPAREAVR